MNGREWLNGFMFFFKSLFNTLDAQNVDFSPSNMKLKEMYPLSLFQLLIIIIIIISVYSHRYGFMFFFKGLFNTLDAQNVDFSPSNMKLKEMYPLSLFQLLIIIIIISVYSHRYRVDIEQTLLYMYH